MSAELLVEAHGSFGSAHCTSCETEYSQDYFKDKVTNCSDGKLNAEGQVIPWCLCDKPDCNGNVKPDIVFFGEPLPKRYFELRQQDMETADLLIVAGTSLKVTPFAHTMHICNPSAPRLLINRERVGEEDMMSNVSNLSRSDLKRTLSMEWDYDANLIF